MLNEFGILFVVIALVMAFRFQWKQTGGQYISPRYLYATAIMLALSLCICVSWLVGSLSV